MKPVKILIVDDDELICESLKQLFLTRGYAAVDCAGDGRMALEMIKKGNYGIVVSDIRMPRLGGLNLLSEIKTFNPHIEVIMITAHANLDIALQCMGNGAFGFFQKPIESLEEVYEIVGKAADVHLLKKKMILKAMSGK